jgi:hypothetical protein
MLGKQVNKFQQGLKLLLWKEFLESSCQDHQKIIEGFGQNDLYLHSLFK